MPASTSQVSGGPAEAFCPASTRVPLVARQSKGFFVATVNGNRHTLYGWPVGATRPQNLAGGSSFEQYVAAASPGPKASVWVGWVDDDGQITVRRSNPTATVFGTPVTLNGPRDGSMFGLDLNAQADRVDLIARVQHSSGTVGLEHTQSYPGLDPHSYEWQAADIPRPGRGRPVEHATITVAGQSASTGSDGRVTLTIDYPGRYTARATAPKYVSAAARVTVSQR